MAAPEYQFTTHWRVRGTPEEVYDILEDPNELPRWWPAVYLDVTELEGQGDSEDSVYELHTTGWLPYTLRWQAHPGERNRPHRIELDAQGDLAGHGVWAIAEDGSWTEITYEWRIRANKPLLRRFSWIVRPLFVANHRWAMDKGEESLRCELVRRRTPAEDVQHPAPPQPTPTSSLPFLLGGLLVIGAVYWVIRTARARR